MPEAGDAVDVCGLPVGSGGICVVRREADLAAMLAVGVITGGVPPIGVIGVLLLAASYGLLPATGEAVSGTLLAAVLALLVISPMLLTRRLLRRWAVVETRYQIDRRGLNRTSVRPRCSLAFRIPPERTVRWDELASSGDGRNTSSSPPIIPWHTRKLCDHDGRLLLTISGASDWLNGDAVISPLVPAFTDDEWPNLSTEEFILAAIFAFRQAHAGEVTPKDQ